MDPAADGAHARVIAYMKADASQAGVGGYINPERRADGWDGTTERPQSGQDGALDTSRHHVAHACGRKAPEASRVRSTTPCGRGQQEYKYDRLGGMDFFRVYRCRAGVTPTDRHARRQQRLARMTSRPVSIRTVGATDPMAAARAPYRRGAAAGEDQPMVILRALPLDCFGSVSVSTPLSYWALALSASTSPGSVNERNTFP